MKTKVKGVKDKSGYSLVELVIYISLLSIMIVIVVNTIISFTRSYHNLGALRAVEHSANDAMERISRDIRSASTVDAANSTLGSSPGVLTLIATAGGFSTTTKFYIQNNILKMDINGVYYGPLSLTSATVSNLVFRDLSSAVSYAVKIDMTIQATVGQVTKTKTYHSTVILRGQ